ncbi:hypothetical protein D3C86_1653570 [compost metagenome]
MRFKPGCRFIANCAWGTQNAARARSVLEERRAIVLHLQRLAGRQGAGVERRNTDQGVEKAIHAVVDNFTSRDSHAAGDLV